MTDFLNRSTRLCGRSTALYSRFTVIIVDTSPVIVWVIEASASYSFCKINTRPSRYLYRLILPSSSKSGSPLEILDRHDTFYVTILGGVYRCLTLPQSSKNEIYIEIYIVAHKIEDKTQQTNFSGEMRFDRHCCLLLNGLRQQFISLV